MRESRTYGSVRGALSNERPYRDRVLFLSTHTIAAAPLPTQTSLRSLRKLDCACGFVPTPRSMVPRRMVGKGAQA